MRNAPSFQNCDLDTFASTSTRIVTAVNERGALCHSVVEKCLFLSGFAVNPQTKPQDAFAAGNAIDALLENESQLEGISKMFLLVPASAEPLADDELTTEIKNVRVYLRRIPQTSMMNNTLGIAQSATAHYIN
jgi:hypothetical protein